MAMSPTLSPFPRSASLVAKDGMWRSRCIFVPAPSPTARWRRKSGTNRVKRGARRVHEIPPGEPQETRRRPTGKHRWPSAFPGQRRSKCDQAHAAAPGAPVRSDPHPPVLGHRCHTQSATSSRGAVAISGVSPMRLCLHQDVRLPACPTAGSETRPSRRPPRYMRALAAAATVFLLAASLPGLAAEWFVSTAGNDSTGTGTLQKPFRTIRHAAAGSVSSAGDTITIRGPSGNRTYSECEVRLRHRLVLRSHPGERAHIQCGNTSDVAVRIDVNASGSRVAGLEISGGYYGVMLMTNWEQGGPSSAHGARNVVLEDLLIHDTGRDGIKVTPKSDHATIRRVEIHTTGVGYPPGTPDDSKNADGIDNVNGSGMVVEDSYIHDTATTGLYFKGGAADVVIQRNRIEDTGDAGILVGFDTSPEFFDLQLNPGYYEAIRGTVRNNYVRNTGYAGIGMYASMDSLVANNTIVNAARKGHAPLYFGVTFQDWDPAAGRPANRNPMLRNNLVVQDGGRCVEIRYSSELGGLSGLSG